jgi:parvulin-like peptidyl-prolyl isomerase
MPPYLAARDHSSAAKAKQDPDEVGRVNQGEVEPTLDQVMFTLKSGKISGHVEMPAGRHLVAVLEVNEDGFTGFADENTRRLTRREYLHEKLNAYIADLHNNQFPVQVYQDRLVQLERKADRWTLDYIIDICLTDNLIQQ